ncbi:uncharacterized protein LAJ45_11602 [Morchella importuna]|uniref:uncharacterized protein n=1 Tax=Morchella importuna TaxID=1174673 RepID=UPI001E8E9C64|nr:uncharacterized protein LAJ45_11602 [Morchella importuna]KAH8144434.1 hypothetical protein LAJ45_11602 [Morchella importuna]
MAIVETLIYTVGSIAGAGFWKYGILAVMPFLWFWLNLRYGLGDFDIPTIGVPPGLLGPWIAPYNWMKNSPHLIREGMAKYGARGLPFKIRSPSRWMVFVNKPTIIDELIRLPKNVVSSSAALDDIFFTQFTMYKDAASDPPFAEIVLKQLSGRCWEFMPLAVEEVKMAWDEKTKIGEEWTDVPVWEVFIQLAARAVIRSIIGAPLCRNQELLDNIIAYAEGVIMHSELLEIIPATLRPFVNKFIFRNKPLDVCMSYFGPIFQERRNIMKDGKYSGNVKPDDGFQWVIDTCPPDTTIERMVKKLLFIFTAGIHTTAVAGTHCVHDIAAIPHFQGPAREEIAQELGAASTVKETKEAWAPMRKLDSVLRESARMNRTHLGTVMRKFMVPYTFSDGMEIPKGAWVVGASSTIHRTNIYEDPDTFDGFRFSRMREEAG